MERLATAVVMFAIFIAFYAFLLRRARRSGRPAEIQWGWLAAVVLCAGVAIAAGFLM